MNAAAWPSRSAASGSGRSRSRVGGVSPGKGPAVISSDALEALRRPASGPADPRGLRGEVVALLGPNGSGKTTCLKAAAGLIRPTRARCRGSGGRPASPPPATLSFLPQRVAFPETLTGREVLEFYRALRGAPPARSDEVLRLASLNGAGDRAVGTYSGGMVQRLGLAVATLPDAPILLLDEPTAALDPDGLCAFYGLVLRAGAGEDRPLHVAPPRRRRAPRRPVRRAGRGPARRAPLRRELAPLAERGVRLDRPRRGGWTLYRELVEERR